MAVTTIVITDPELLAKLAAADGQIIFRGPTGDTVKTAEVVANTKLPPGFKIPFSDEELARRSQIRTGRPIGEVLKDLKEKYGE
ncbi:MAG: hypothetical protein C0467_28045 [Planctomycetaceae bacterium]|nr:hypothetical protein [Planctomycetaceae bacterium]